MKTIRNNHGAPHPYSLEYRHGGHPRAHQIHCRKYLRLFPLQVGSWAMVSNMTNWRESAKCNRMEPWRFDLSDRRILERDRPDEAMRLCSGCSVIRECATECVTETGYKLQTTTRAGVWVPESSHKSYLQAMGQLVKVSAGKC